MAGRIAYYGNIVTDGLVLNLDAAKRDSYPGSGTAWRDISGFGNNGTLINGPTFNPNNFGSIVFDGVDDYINFSPINTTSNFTYNFIFNISNLTLSINTLVIGSAAYGGQNVAFHSTSNAILVCSTNPSHFIYFTGYNWFSNKGLHEYTITTEYTTTTTFRLYVDGILRDTKTNDSYNNFRPSVSRINRSNGTTYSAHVFRLYNRALSATEVLQNFNATKGRYGL